MLSTSSSPSPQAAATPFLRRTPPFLRHLLHYQALPLRRTPPAAAHCSFSLREVKQTAPLPPSAVGAGLEREAESQLQPFPTIKASKRVVLVRHGQSTWNEEGRIQGSSDFSVLTVKGEAQAETSRQMLLADSFDVCFTSPLARSRRTAEIIWGSRKEKMIPDLELREIDLYSFQGLLKKEGKERFGQVYRQWQKDPANFRVDGHYPVQELWARARNCWDQILAHDGNSVLVVAHNAVNQALVATAMGLGTQYFRILLQSNCGVSVLDFTPKYGGGSPHISLNRLNQTPNSPVSSGSGGRKTGKQIILVCYGATQNNTEVSFPNSGYAPMNMLGVIQSQKTAELLLDVNMDSIICSPRVASIDTSTAIAEVQEAADCLGADCVPRYVEMKKMLELEVENILQGGRTNKSNSSIGRQNWTSGFSEATINSLWDQSAKAWRSLLLELSGETEQEKNVVVVGHPALHAALIGHCLNLRMENLGSFQLDSGSVSILDFPDGSSGRGVIRCINYTAHLGRWSIPVTRSTTNDEEF